MEKQPEAQTFIQRIKFFTDLIEDMGEHADPKIKKARLHMMQGVVDYVEALKANEQEVDPKGIANAMEGLQKRFDQAQLDMYDGVISRLQAMHKQFDPIVRQLDQRHPDTALLQRGYRGLQKLTQSMTTARKAALAGDIKGRDEALKLSDEARELLEPLIRYTDSLD